MQIILIRSDLARPPDRPPSLVARCGAVWMWPGIPLTKRRGDAIVPLPAETIRSWLVLLHGPEAVHSAAVVQIASAAEYLSRGEEAAAQRALDRARLSHLSPEGAVVMGAVARAFNISPLGLPILSRNPLWPRDYCLRIAGVFDACRDEAEWFERAGWDPDKHPRWPEGAPDSQGGRFREAGGGTATPKVSAPKAAPAPERPGIGHNGGPALFDDAPEVPPDDPGPSSRWQTLKRIARWLGPKLATLAAEDAAGGGAIGILLDAAQIALWVRDYYPYLAAYNDPPKTLAELNDEAQGPRRTGYDIHHIVWQTDGAKDGIPVEILQSRENLVSIPTFRHWELNRWFQKSNQKYNNTSPRDYLRDKDYNERRAVGLHGLRDVGVLKK